MQLSGLPHLVIVSAGALIQVSPSAAIPVMSSIPRTDSIRPPNRTSSEFVVAETSSSAAMLTAASAPAVKSSVPRLSRLNAIDLSVSAVSDSDVPRRADGGGDAADRRRVRARREIVPVPCGAARVGSSSRQCAVCQKAFSSSALLAVHRNIHYLGAPRPPRCAACRSTFSSRALLDRHRTHHHAGEPPDSTDPRPYKCDQCAVAFRIQGHLDKHKRSKVSAAHICKEQQTSFVCYPSSGLQCE